MTRQEIIDRINLGETVSIFTGDTTMLLHSVAEVPTQAVLDSYSYLKAGGRVELLPGVTGRGTRSNPYKGWHTYLAASTGGEVWSFSAAWYYTPVEIRISSSQVKLIGVAVGATFLVGGDARPFKAIIRVARQDAGEMTHVEVKGITFDGDGVTDYGLILRNVNYSTFDVDFRNAKSWCMRTSRGICNGGRIRAIASLMDKLVTPNGLYLGEAPFTIPYIDTPGRAVGTYPGEDNSPASSDYYTTCSTWDTIEIQSLPGTGLEINQSFSVLFDAGAVEGCSINLKLHDNTYFCIFNGINFEQATSSPGMIVSGNSHHFNRCECVNTDVLFDAGSMGGHQFDFCRVRDVVDNGSLTAANYWRWANPSAMLPVTGTNRDNNVLIDGAGHRRRYGTNVYVAESQGGGTVGFTMLVGGVAEGGMHATTSGWLYLSNHGTLFNYDDASLKAKAAIAVKGTDVKINKKLIGHTGELSFVGLLGDGVTEIAGRLNVIPDNNDVYLQNAVAGGRVYITAPGITDLGGVIIKATYFRTTGKLGVGGITAATGPVGAIVGKMEVTDGEGVAKGFIPIYNAIT
jgi:hypothetical protein